MKNFFKKIVAWCKTHVWQSAVIGAVTVGVVATAIAVPVALSNKEPAHQHTFASDWSSDGEKHWHAATCEHTDVKADEASHVWGEWSIKTPATHTSAGVKERECSVCHKVVQEAINPLDHTFDKEVVDNKYLKSAATCLEPAVYFKSCECGEASDSLTFTHGDPLGHSINPITGICERCEQAFGKTVSYEDERVDSEFPVVNNVAYFNFTTIEADSLWFDTETANISNKQVVSVKLYKDGDFENDIPLFTNLEVTLEEYFYADSSSPLEADTKYFVVVQFAEGVVTDSVTFYFSALVKYEPTLTWVEAFTGKKYDGQPISVEAESNSGGEITYWYKTHGQPDDAYTTTAPSKVGMYMVKATVAETDTFGEKSISNTYYLEPRDVKLQWAAPESLVYDGNEKYGSVELENVLEGDDCYIPNDGIVLEGDNKNYSADGFKFKVTNLAGEDAENYKLPSNCYSPTLGIEKKDMEIISISVTYNGTNSFEGVVIDALNTVDYACTDDYESIKLDISKTGTIDAGMYNIYNGGDWTVTVSSDSNPNYNVLLDADHAFVLTVNKIEMKLDATVGCKKGTSYGSWGIDSSMTDAPLYGDPTIELGSLAALEYGLHENYMYWDLDETSKVNYDLSSSSKVNVFIYEEDITSDFLASPGHEDTFEANVPKYYAFTPTKSGVCRATSTDSIKCDIYNSSQSVQVQYATHYYLEAGHEYYISVSSSTAKTLSFYLAFDSDGTSITGSGYTYKANPNTIYAWFEIETEGPYIATKGTLGTFEVFGVNGKITPFEGYYNLGPGYYVARLQGTEQVTISLNLAV